MSKPDTWMPLVIGDYLADTVHLSTAEHGAYLLMLMTAWMRGGTLPDDDAQLARIARASSREWKTLRASLAPFFHVADGEWRQKRLLKELAAANAKAAMAGAKASEAAATRWGKHPPPDAPSIPPSNAPSNATGNAPALLEQSPIPIPITPPSLRSGGKAARAKATAIDDNFAISDRVRAWAERNGHTPVLQAAFETFVGRNKASGKTYIDWDQALMNAIREDWYDLKKLNGSAKNPLTERWWDSEAGTVAKGAEFGMAPRGGESWNDFRGRIRARLGQ